MNNELRQEKKKKTYIEANQLHSNIVNVISTSKKVGVLAQSMVSNKLVSSNVKRFTNYLESFNSLTDLFRGLIVQTYYNFPKPIISDVLRNSKENLATLLGLKMASFDLKSIKEALINRFCDTIKCEVSS